MAHSESFSFVVPSPGRSFDSDDWEEMDLADIKAWKLAADCLRDIHFVVNGADYTVTFDWSPMVQRHERYREINKYIKSGDPNKINKRFSEAKFPEGPCVIKVSVSTEATIPTSFSGIVESAVYDVFLILNICAPGCCNFLHASLQSKDSKEDISLSSYLFEILLATKTWPTIRVLDLGTVATWYFSVRNSVTQVPRSPTERCLFALMHLARLDGDIVCVVWIFYALESLLQTRSGENFSAIVRRLALLFDASEREISILRKELRELYDARSAIVHGGFEVFHPMRHGILDKRADQVFGDLLSTMDCGYKVLVVALQQMASRGWTSLSFDEVIGGCN